MFTFSTSKFRKTINSFSRIVPLFLIIYTSCTPAKEIKSLDLSKSIFLNSSISTKYEISTITDPKVGTYYKMDPKNPSIENITDEINYFTSISECFNNKKKSLSKAYTKGVARQLLTGLKEIRVEKQYKENDLYISYSDAKLDTSDPEERKINYSPLNDEKSNSYKQYDEPVYFVTLTREDKNCLYHSIFWSKSPKIQSENKVGEFKNISEQILATSNNSK